MGPLTHLMPGVLVKLNGAAAQTPDLTIIARDRKLVWLVALLQATGHGLCLGRGFPRLLFLCARFCGVFCRLVVLLRVLEQQHIETPEA